MKPAFDIRRRRSARRGGSRHRGRKPRFGRIELVTVVLAGIVGGLVWAQLPVADAPRRTALIEPSSDRGEVRGMTAPVTASFGYCRSGGGTNCVVDGDTFRLDGVKIRIADIDTPETHPARCAREAELGAAATDRLHVLLNGGAVSLTAIDRDEDRYGRKLRIVSVDGRGVGDTLVAEGLARRYAGGRRAGWCDGLGRFDRLARDAGTRP